MRTIGQHKIRRAHPAGLGVSRRRALRVYAQRGSFATESLEKAIQTINKLIFEQEQRRQRARANAQHRGGNRKAVEVQAVEVEGKPVTFRASARTEKLIKVGLRARGTRLSVGDFTRSPGGRGLQRALFPAPYKHGTALSPYSRCG